VATVDEVFVPAIALGELYYGARKLARSEANINRIDEFAAAMATSGAMGPPLGTTDGSKMICAPRAGPFRKTLSGLPRSLCSTV